jgi:hypothetical protein
MQFFVSLKIFNVQAEGRGKTRLEASTYGDERSLKEATLKTTR